MFLPSLHPAPAFQLDLSTAFCTTFFDLLLKHFPLPCVLIDFVHIFLHERETFQDQDHIFK